ncbi:MAG TPA: hypothetical protein PLZ61_02210 [Candidatus Cryosericum sp.]|nr:hypothetical protein [Candidatus Cryosericum sp.]
MPDPQDRTQITTTSYIKASLLIGNGCTLVAHKLNESNLVDFTLDIPPEAADRAAMVEKVCVPTVGTHVRKLRDIIRTETGGRHGG